MLSPILTLVIVCCISSSIVDCAPTKEVYLEADSKTVKTGPSQEDLDQFFKDQSHLLEEKQDDGTVGTFGQPLSDALNQLPAGSLSQFYQLFTILNQLGLPTMLDPTAIGQALASNLLSQLIDVLRQNSRT